MPQSVLTRDWQVNPQLADYLARGLAGLEVVEKLLTSAMVALLRSRVPLYQAM